MTFIRDAIVQWAENREPDFIIGGREDPYLKRHWLLPRNVMVSGRTRSA